jgi:hypothetical protein
MTAWNDIALCSQYTLGLKDSIQDKLGEQERVLDFVLSTRLKNNARTNETGYPELEAPLHASWRGTLATPSRTVHRSNTPLLHDPCIHQTRRARQHTDSNRQHSTKGNPEPNPHCTRDQFGNEESLSIRVRPALDNSQDIQLSAIHHVMESLPVEYRMDNLIRRGRMD